MDQTTLQHDFALALQNHQGGRVREAEALYRQILARQPAHAGAMHYLGVIAHSQGKNVDAIDLIRRAIAIDPASLEAHNNLGLALKANGQLDEAIAAYRQAIALKPDFAQAHSNLIVTQNYQPGLDAKEVAEELSRWNQQHAAPLRRYIRYSNDRNPDRRIRVGYVSADFCAHACAHFVVPLVHNHDPQQVEFSVMPTCAVPMPSRTTCSSARRRGETMLACPMNNWPGKSAKIESTCWSI
jgi:predicted O-linked N-acetylglucosamine transferase (SPINDLY family)